MATTSEPQNNPHRRERVHNQARRPDVENSIALLLIDIGASSPRAFLNRWTPEQIIPQLTELKGAMSGSRSIRNPAGLLWRMLEDSELMEGKQ